MTSIVAGITVNHVRVERYVLMDRVGLLIWRKHRCEEFGADPRMTSGDNSGGGDCCTTGVISDRCIGLFLRCLLLCILYYTTTQFIIIVCVSSAPLIKAVDKQTRTTQPTRY